MSWNFIGKAPKPRGSLTQQPLVKRTAPARVYHAPPSFADHAKPQKRIVDRPLLDAPRPQRRFYNNPGPGQGITTSPAPTTSTALPAGVSRTHVQSQGRTWKAFTFDLSVARIDQPIWLPGDLVWYFASTNATDQLSVRFVDVPGDQRCDPLPLHPGNAIGNSPFKGIAVSNSAIAGATATIVITDSPAEIDGSE